MRILIVKMRCGEVPGSARLDSALWENCSGPVNERRQKDEYTASMPVEAHLSNHHLLIPREQLRKSNGLFDSRTGRSPRGAGAPSGNLLHHRSAI